MGVPADTFVLNLTMATAFQVIFKADEDDNRPSLKQHRVFRDRYICFTIMIYTNR